MAQVAAEIAEKQAAQEAQTKLRYFDTTNKDNHGAKDLC